MVHSRTPMWVVVPAAAVGSLVWLVTAACGLMVLGTIIAGITGVVS